METRTDLTGTRFPARTAGGTRVHVAQTRTGGALPATTLCGARIARFAYGEAVTCTRCAKATR